MTQKLTTEEKEANRKAKKQAKSLAKELAEKEQERNQPEVKELLITIEWKKSRTWGANPHAEAAVTFKDGKEGPWRTGFFRSYNHTCSGCGYDKESTVIAEIFNLFLKYKLWNKSIEECNGHPYGNNAGKYHSSSCGAEIEYRYYAGGVGTSCYYRIAEAIGGKFEHVASGSTFDVYKYTDNENN
jgi:hypothetical protein